MTYHVHAFSDILGLEDALDDLNGKIDDHIADLDNPHQTSLENLIDTDTANPKDGQTILYNALTGLWTAQAGVFESWPTGLANGGELNIGPGVNDIEVIAGFGAIVDSYTDPLAPPAITGVKWDQINEPITVAPSVAGSIVWFSIFNTGVPAVPIPGIPVELFIGELRQYATPPGPSLARAEIFLGVALHNGVTWNEVSNPKVINAAAETLREVATTVLPLTSIISGGSVNELPAFELEQEAGIVWENNRNWHVDKSNPNREALPAAAPINFQYVNRDFTDVGLLTTTVDPSQWDDGGVVSAVPGPANTATIQRLYLDPANNYWILYGQFTYPNFTVAQANLNAETPVVPFILQNSILLGYVIAEKGKNDWDIDEAIFVGAGGGAGGSAGGGVPVTQFIDLSDTPPSYGGQFPLVPVVNAAELALEFDYRTKAVGDYIEGITYNIGDEVFNGSDLSEAKINGVQSYPFVAPTGDTLQIYQGTMPTDAKTAKQVIFGNRYTSLTKGFFINGYRVYTVVGNSYEVVSVTDPLGTPVFNQVASFTGTVNGWFDLPISSVAVGIGTVFDLTCTVSEPDPTPIEVIASYDYQTPQNPAAPLAGEIIQARSLPSVLAISYTDAAAGDQTALIQGLSIGDIIRLGQVQYSVQTNTPQVGYSDVVVAPALTTTPTGIQDVTFETVATTPITIGEDPLYWPTSAFPATQGLLGVDIPYADIVPDDNAYGIDISVQEAFIPDQTEWQLKIIGPLNGGGGGGGEAPSGGGATEVTVEQVAHGFGTLDCIRWDGAAWVFARANNPDTTALGVVVEVISDDAFKYAITGAYDLETPHGLVIDQWYYLSQNTPGGLDIDEPLISQPIVYIETATKFSVYAYRPALLGEELAKVQTPMLSVTTLVDVPFTGRQTAPLGTVVQEQNASEYFLADGTGITVLKDCLALVSYQFSIGLVVLADTRTTTFHRIAVNGDINQFSKQYTYHRNDLNPYGAVAAEVPIQLVAGDQITYEVAYLVTATSAACQVLNNSGNMTARVIDQEFTRGPPGVGWGYGTDPNDIVNTNSGNVGIGTADPVSSLHVQAADTLGVALTLQTTNNATDRCNIDIKTDAAPTSGNIRIGGEGTSLFFRTGSAERMRITNTGNVGIGVVPDASPKLHVAGTQWIEENGIEGPILQMRADIASGDIDISASYRTGTWGDMTFSTLAAETMRITAGPARGLQMSGAEAPTGTGTISSAGYKTRRGTSTGGTQGSNFNFDWTGVLNSWVDTVLIGQVSIVSDYRTKEYVTTMTYSEGDSAVERIGQLNVVQFQRANNTEDFNGIFANAADGVVRAGFIAHELQAVIPSAVEGKKDDPDRVQSLNIDALCAVMVQSIQELTARVKELEAR